MRIDIATPKLFGEMEEYCVKNSDFTVEQVMNKYNVTQPIAFQVIMSASKKLK